jgi:hypothetical protein
MQTDNSTSCSRLSESEVSDDSDESDESVSSPVSASGGGSNGGGSNGGGSNGNGSSSLEELKSGLNLDKCIAIAYDSPHDFPVASIGISIADQDCKRQEDGAQYKLHDAIVG